MTSTIRKQYENWIDNKWRPAAAWVYLAICLFDFILAPIVFAIIQMVSGQPIVQWSPITLMGSGLVHMSFGAIIGITAFGRTREKIEEQNK